MGKSHQWGNDLLLKGGDYLGGGVELAAKF